jgi:flagellar hook-associated protein 1
MGNILYGLNIASNTLRAQSTVLNVTAHNIANANTPGYSRQEALLSQVSDQALAGLRMGSVLSIGSGVEVSEVSRVRYSLYDEIYRKENQGLNYNKSTEDLLNQVELLFDEPSNNSLGGIIDSFFNGWLDVSNQPQDTAARQSLYSTAVELTDRFKRIYTSLENMREDIDSQIAAIPEQINLITSEIADLNVVIRKSEVSGNIANDLRDQRDLLIDQLTGYIDVTSIEQDNGTTTVLAGGKVVVEGATSSTVGVTSTITASGYRKTAIVAEDGTEYVPVSGKLGALNDFRDTVIKDIMDQLNTLAGAIVDTINYDHQVGYGLDGQTGRNFFEPALTKAYNITVSSDIKDVSHIAVSIDGATGDNTNALNINSLKTRKVIDGSFTINEYYNSIISQLGVIGKEAQANRTNQELLVTQIDNSRESIKGVSVDEELVQMIQTQRIYQSASRIIVVLDGLLEEVVNLVR